MVDAVKQKVVFGTVYISYMLFVYNKRSVTYAMPDISQMEELDKNQMGMILSSQLVAYALSKFLSGMLIDLVSPRLLLATGLLLSALSTYLFASCYGGANILTILWILNGVFCGPGWPASALILKKWFRKDQFGTVWGMLSTSMNVAGTLGPLITAYFITHSGWRQSLVVASMAAILWVFPILFLVQDNPISPDREGANENEHKEEKEKEAKMSRWEIMRLPGFLGVCITYGIISVVQYGLLQWGPVYLVNDLGQSILKSSSYTSSLEVGGICGSLLAGYYSDILIRQRPQLPNPLIRQYVMAWFVSGLAGFLFLFTYCVSFYSSVLWINILGFGLGLCLYGPISIFGVVAMESAPNHFAGAAHATSTIFANGGHAVAGLPLGYIAKYWGWKATFQIQLILVVFMAAYLFIYSTVNINKSSARLKKD